MLHWTTPRYLGWEGDPAPEPKPDDGNDPEKFKIAVQAEVDKHMAGMRRKYEAQLEEANEDRRKLAEELEKQRKATNDPEQQEAFQRQIEELRSKFESEAEKAERTAKKKETELTSQLEQMTAAAQSATRAWESEVVRNTVFSACSHPDIKAFDPDTIERLLAPHIKFVPVENEDGSHGKPVPKVIGVPYDVDKEGKPVTIEYTIQEAVKRMTELDRHHYLFEGTLKSGLGGTKNSEGKLVNAEELRKDPAAYRELRKKAAAGDRQARKALHQLYQQP